MAYKVIADFAYTTSDGTKQTAIHIETGKHLSRDQAIDTVAALVTLLTVPMVTIGQQGIRVVWEDGPPPANIP